MQTKLKLIFLSLFLGLSQAASADTCLLRIRVSLEAQVEAAHYIEAHLIIDRSGDVHVHGSGPFVAQRGSRWLPGDWQEISVELPHFDRSQTLSITYVAYDATDAPVFSNGMSDVDVPSQCANRWEPVSLPVIGIDDLKLEHVAGFDDFDRLLREPETLIVRFQHLHNVLLLNPNFPEEIDSEIERMLTQASAAFESMSDSERDAFLLSLRELVRAGIDMEPSRRESIFQGYRNLLGGAMAVVRTGYRAHGNMNFDNYVLRELGMTVADDPNGALRAVTDRVLFLAEEADYHTGEDPDYRAAQSDVCMSMARIGFRAVLQADLDDQEMADLTLQLFRGSLSCMHDYYDLFGGASRFNSYEVLEVFEDDPDIGDDLHENMALAYSCLPDDIRDAVHGMLARAFVDISDDDNLFPQLMENGRRAGQYCP